MWSLSDQTGPELYCIRRDVERGQNDPTVDGNLLVVAVVVVEEEVGVDVVPFFWYLEARRQELQT